MIGRYICTNYSQVELDPENLADGGWDRCSVDILYIKHQVFLCDQSLFQGADQGDWDMLEDGNILRFAELGELTSDHDVGDQRLPGLPHRSRKEKTSLLCRWCACPALSAECEFQKSWQSWETLIVIRNLIKCVYFIIFIMWILFINLFLFCIYMKGKSQTSTNHLLTCKQGCRPGTPC